MADTMNSPRGSTSASPHQYAASVEADPFLSDLPNKDIYPLNLDDSPLPLPDTLPAQNSTHEDASPTGNKKMPPGEASKAFLNAEDEAGQRECLFGVLCLPPHITLFSHGAHEFRIGRFSGKTALAIVLLPCAIFLTFLVLAIISRSSMMRGFFMLP